MSSRSKVPSNRSFKLWGLIENMPVLILIDSGATRSFISNKLVEKMKLKKENTVNYNVKLANGDKVQQRGICKGLKLYMQGIEVEQNFLLMTLEGYDVILGMDWLASLGDVRANFKQLVIKWKKGTKEFMIRGEPYSRRSVQGYVQQKKGGCLVDRFKAMFF